MAEFRYTPYLQQAGKTIGAGLESIGNTRLKQQVNALAGKAQMGDPQALQQLMEISPQTGMAIQQGLQRQKAATDQKNLQSQTAVAGEMKSAQVEARRIEENAAKFGTYEEANAYVKEETQKLAQQYPMLMQKHPEIFDPNQETYTPEDYAQSKTVYGKAPEAAGGAFAGSGMAAQVSNALVKGASDPEYRNTPEYARAWDIANKPTIIDTEEGRIPLYPKIDPMFKAPGDTKPVNQEVAEIRAVVKQDSEVIKGTEKTKSSADEKVSYGFYNRMMGAEENIEGLGEFDSSSVWERFRGLTNISSSPELQQYRQAADDWIRAKLRRESGAVIGKDEMDKEYEIYFPRIGDSQEVIDQKIRAREEAERSMKTAAGRAYKKEEKKKGDQAPVVNEPDLSVTIGGKVWKFQSLEALNAYKKAARL